ncbi:MULTISPECIES: 3',5'-cyclic-nucleotide phosphodiesterase [Caldimonas]|uniref:MBL fold metallo-hydrolase n=1 Tax=Caldimonas TaxID=196013 RepID=UPI00036C5286|nr:3',5'-cyclic-nucleotide phosphodiesterase [Caldimonas manganoxidans]
MKIRVLGCSGAIAAGCKTTAFLLDDDLLVDAGTGVGDLTLEELARIDHILVSHSHLDHIVAIPLLADSVMGRRRQPIVVHALPATIEALRRHVLNDVIWPDFGRLPSAEAPVLRFSPIEVGQRLELGGKTIEVLPARHTVPAVGYAVCAGVGAAAGRWWVYTGDTGPNPALWPRLAGRQVGMLVIETAFGDQERALAALSQHHCPSSLRRELQHIDPRWPLYLTHAKPGEMLRIADQVRALDGSHRIAHLEAGQVFEL